MIGYLCPRERAVARYLLGGWTYESIGYQLDVSLSVVRYCAHRVIRATGRRDVTSAVLSILRCSESLAMVMEVPL